jgi:class 3 adenylate cyclase
VGIAEDLTAAVTKIFDDAWDKRQGQKVPESADISLANQGVELEATVLYADLAGSTKMVDGTKAEFSAEVYKAYLHCAANLIRYHNGTVTAYDGDRIMGVFIGDSKNTSAAKCGLRINWAVTKVINPAIVAQYRGTTFSVRQVVGIDTSSLLVARTGVRGANDLVWVGRSANYAAKLTELNPDYPTWITHRVYENMHASAKTSSGGSSMWASHTWRAMSNLSIFGSTWSWAPGT